MKALSIKQPWATMIATGEKTIETRTWSTKYRGRLLICSGKTPVAQILRVTTPDMLLGMGLCTVNLVNVRPYLESDCTASCCDYCPNAYAWVLEDIRPLQPFPVKGMLRIFDVDYEEE